MNHTMEAVISIHRRVPCVRQASRECARGRVALAGRPDAPRHMPLRGLVKFDIDGDLAGETGFSISAMDTNIGDLFVRDPALFTLLFGHRMVPNSGR
jgi:hypothetical protein